MLEPTAVPGSRGRAVEGTARPRLVRATSPSCHVRRHQQRHLDLGGGQAAVHADQREQSGRLDARVGQVAAADGRARPRRRSCPSASSHTVGPNSPVATASSREPTQKCSADRRPPGGEHVVGRAGPHADVHAAQVAADQLDSRVEHRRRRDVPAVRRRDVHHAVVGGHQQRRARRQRVGAAARRSASTARSSARHAARRQPLRWPPGPGRRSRRRSATARHGVPPRRPPPRSPSGLGRRVGDRRAARPGSGRRRRSAAGRPG